MREVTIPEGWNPCKITVNNVTYEYPAGQTVEVPDEVADVIDRFNGAKVPEPEKLEYVEGFSYDPVADAGKVLQIRDNGRGIEWGANSGGGPRGGLSDFDEFCGFTGSAHITLNLVLPQEDPGPFKSTYCHINVWDTSGEEYLKKMEIHFTDLHTNEIVVPVSESYVIEIANVGGETNSGYYYCDLGSATLSGDLTTDENVNGVVVNGDGTITTEAISD